MASKFPERVGDTEWRTKRVAVRTADFAASDLNGDAPAYYFNKVRDEMGLDPWQLIDGVDPHTNGESFDLSGADANFCKTVGPNFLIFVAAKHAAQFVKEAA